MCGKHEATRVQLIGLVSSSTMKNELRFENDGAQRFDRALSNAQLQTLEVALSDLAPNKAGIRLYDVPALVPLLNSSGPIGAIAAGVLGPKCKPVRAVMFDKSEANNWSLGWHQDRTIVVRERVECEGFGPWTKKDGQLHVAPPFSVLGGMVTVRAHLDDVDSQNAPLLIAPGSHRCGLVREADVAETVQKCGSAACLAKRGDVWLYSTLILHASERARLPKHRRVLQVDFATGDLPGGLQWLGVCGSA